MKVTWRELFGLSVAVLLLGSGVWANVGEGSLSQNRGAWASHAIKKGRSMIRAPIHVPDV
jgi:hypothetical protein